MSADQELHDATLAVLNEQVRPLLHIHGGEARIDRVDAATGTVEVEMLGSCACCALRPWTYTAVLRPRLEAVPGVSTVKVRGVNVSAAAMRRMEALFGGATTVAQERR